MNELIKQARKLIRDISSAYLVFNIYASNHPQTKNAMDQLCEEFKDIFKETAEISFGIKGEEVFFGKEVFFDLTHQLKEFIKKLKEKNIEYIKFRRNLSKEEIADFLEFLSRKNKDKKDFEQKKFEHIELGKFAEELRRTGFEVKEDFKKELPILNHLYEGYINKSRYFLEAIINQRELSPSSLLELASQILDISTQHRKLLLVLTSIKKHDDYTFVHCLNVATLTMFQAKNLGLAEDRIIQLGVAAFLHDLGKVAIKRIILEKREKLTDDELEGIRNHVILGSKLLLKSAHFNKLSFIVNYQHHLGFDLQGYPKAKFLKSQNLASRLIAISDVYDALRSRRSYKESMPLEMIYEIMQRESGRLFDPYLLDFFFKNLGVWPVGTLVRLYSQEVGMVVENNSQEIFRPKVEIFFDEQGRKLDKSFVVDLTEKDQRGNFKRSILRHLSPLGEDQKFIIELFGDI